MNKDDFKLIYNKIFEVTSFKLISTKKLSKDFYEVIAVDDNNSKVILSLTDPNSINENLSHLNSLLFKEYLNANSLFVFEKTKKEQIEELFKNLNYEYINDVIISCYAIGQDFGFYESMKKQDVFNLADGFNCVYGKSKAKSVVVLTNIGEIHFQSVLVEQNTDNLRWITKKSICIYNRFKIINNELHPIVLLTLPYAPRKNITFHLDLHPSFKNESKIRFEIIIKEFEAALSHYLDTLLKRHLKMNVKELKQLSIDEKKNYLLIAHMNKI